MARRDLPGGTAWDPTRSDEIRLIENEMAALRAQADVVQAQATGLTRHGSEGASRFQLEMRASELRARIRELNSRWCDLAEKRHCERRRA